MSKNWYQMMVDELTGKHIIVATTLVDGLVIDDEPEDEDEDETF